MEILTGLLLAVPLAFCMGATAVVVYSLEASALALPPDSWQPGNTPFSIIFVLWALLLWVCSVVDEIKAGAMLMVRVLLLACDVIVLVECT